MNEEKKVPKPKRWTELEKRVLLKEMKKYGSDDIESIRQHLPHRTSASVFNMIRKYQTIAELGKKEVNSPLDVWLRSGIFDKEKNFVADAILFISLFEKHPPPEETGGFDLKQAYNFLYEALNGQVITTLPQQTGEMMKELISTIDKEDKPLNDNITTDFLIKKLHATNLFKCYKRRKVSFKSV